MRPARIATPDRTTAIPVIVVSSGVNTGYVVARVEQNIVVEEIVTHPTTRRFVKWSIRSIKDVVKHSPMRLRAAVITRHPLAEFF